jgi:glycosyltransferase involved in cell wall biosynthesis
MSLLTQQQPAFPDVGVVAYVPDDWDCKWQPRHQVLSRLSRYFHVVWVSPPFDWHEAVGLRPARKLPPSPSSPGPGFHVMPPSRLLPKFYAPSWLVREAERRRWRSASRLLKSHGCKTIVAYLWRPEYATVLGFGSQLTCYHVDDEYTFSAQEQPISDAERLVLERAGQVFIHSPALLQKKGSFNTHTAHIPNGVDFSAFATPVAEPADIVSVPHPRIGYAGWLKPQLDWQLLTHVADAHPEWHFVFVGGVHPRPDNVAAVHTLQSRPNVHLLGPKDTPDLALYPQHFDVCIMPYCRDDYTKFIYPLKVHEYLAAGRPVVGTRLPALEEFAGLVAIPDSPEQWDAAILAALRPESDTPERRSARQAVARAYDWTVLVERIARKITDRLGSPFSSRFAQLLSEPRPAPVPLCSAGAI